MDKVCSMFKFTYVLRDIEMNNCMLCGVSAH